MDEDTKERFEVARNKFIDEIAKGLGMYKILDWLSNTLNKFNKHKN